jgi:hypothetical protein
MPYYKSSKAGALLSDGKKALTMIEEGTMADDRKKRASKRKRCDIGLSGIRLEEMIEEAIVDA